MDRRLPIQDYALPDRYRAATTKAVYCVLALYALHQLLIYYDYPILSPQELLWNALVYIIPAPLLLDTAKRAELRANSNMLSQTHAAKSEALRRMLGVGSGTLTHKLTGGEGIMRSMSMSLAKNEPTTDAPPGLGNWDNSCYQNSVLQGLASLGSMKTYLDESVTARSDTESTSGSLQETIRKLNDASNNGKQLWTPAKLKSMSSWQQQDAQEYFSKIMDELDKDAGRSVTTTKPTSGLEGAIEAKKTQRDGEEAAGSTSITRNPMEGLLAQRVACTRCGFSDGLSMIPFNCLTVPLGSDFAYDLEECLDEYTKLEEISDVDCPKCTLLRAEGQLKQMIPAGDLEDETKDSPAIPLLSLPPQLRILAAKRLQAVQDALEEDDFADKTLNEICQIPKKAHVSSTKTRQAVIGRAPESLVVHVNRSVFDELTGVQRKNYASVRYPQLLDLGAWMLGAQSGGTATQSILRGDPTVCLYRLRAAVTHYGRHENGHYICYRRHPKRAAPEEDLLGNKQPDKSAEQWWRLSDEDVSLVTEEDVLAQGGVFMLFYERDHSLQQPAATEPPVAEQSSTEANLDDAAPEDAASIPLPPDTPTIIEPQRATPTALLPALLPAATPQVSTDSSLASKKEATADAVAEIPRQPPSPVQRRATPSLMRTAHARRARRQGSVSETGFASAMRTMTAV